MSERQIKVFLNQRFHFVVLLGLVWAGALSLGFILPKPAAEKLFSEGDLVENASVAAYLLVVLLLLTWSQASRGFRLHAALVIAFLAMRELDFHNAFTSESFMKLSYYSRGTDPIWGRVLAGVILIAVLVVALTFVIRLLRLRGELVAGRAYAASSLAALLLLPFSKVLDSGAREVHRQIGYDTPDQIRYWITILEESTELAIPLIMLLAIFQYNRSKTLLG